MLALTQGTGLSSDHQHAPRWLVTNGSTIVGPVHTELLLRGYLGGRIPEHCQVRDVRWHDWRPLFGIREIGGLARRLAGDRERPLDLREAAARLPVVQDAGELLTWALDLAARTLDANAGIVHRYRSPVPLLVTSSVHGVPVERLGEVLPAGDVSYQFALRGRGLCGDPRRGVAERLVAERLQYDAPLRSVLSAPVLVNGTLFALIELGRTRHEFRSDDAGDLSEFARHLARRLG